MIKVSGTAKISVDYLVELELTEENWDSLSEEQQNEQIKNSVDWLVVCKNGDIDDIEVDSVLEFEVE